jgi:arylsulfatase A
MTRFAILLPLILVVTAQAAEALERPNMIIMMADDMGIGDTSAYQDFTGNADNVQLYTPQMERLARMGVRFTDAHTPSSRCSPTRYGLLTGRYPWRNRLKHWVLYGAQGDPMIEADRPTIASMLQQNGYRTAMVGKWHIGLRYRQLNGLPAAGWNDADLTRPLHTSPVDYGFEFARFTSRSHGTSGPAVGAKRKAKKANSVNQRGPGHIHERTVVGSTGNGRQLVTSGPNAYVLTKLGSRHSDHAIRFLEQHVTDEDSRQRPFFLYYPSNSNHGPYTPDEAIAGKPVAGAARTVAGNPMDARHDFIYENDVALGRLLNWLTTTSDPRSPGKKLIHSTLVIFTSDNGAEKDSDIATGPFRSHKGSVYEGGHRVPFLVSWSAGGIGDGNPQTPGRTSVDLIALQDLYATIAELIGVPLPDPLVGEKGGEDSFSVLAALRGERLEKRPPLFFNDHKEAPNDRAACAIRLDSPTVSGHQYAGQWKLFFDASLLRSGVANPYELYNLSKDPLEEANLIDKTELQPLVAHLTELARLHRNVGGHRLAKSAPQKRMILNWAEGQDSLASLFAGKPASGVSTKIPDADLKLSLIGTRSNQPLTEARFSIDGTGIGITGGAAESVDGGEAIMIQFDRDVIVESAAIVAGDGTCGGFYRVGDAAPLAIYCVDADIDANDQSGILSDIGLLKAGESLRLDSSRHFGVEAIGQWRLRSLVVRLLD